jgi:DNA-binding NarL/FixJ family response regulator
MGMQSTHPDVITVVILENADTTLAGLLYYLTQPDIKILGASAEPDVILSVVRHHQPDIAIVDMRIYGDDRAGITVTCAILRDSPRTKCIIYTEFDTWENRLAALQAGATLVISKEDRGGSIPTIVSAVRHIARQEQEVGNDARPTPSQNQFVWDTSPILTPRQLEVFYWLSEGLSTDEIAQEMVIEQSTVKRHLLSSYVALGIHKRLAALLYVQKQGWLPAPGTIQRRHTDP